MENSFRKSSKYVNKTLSLIGMSMNKLIICAFPLFFTSNFSVLLLLTPDLLPPFKKILSFSLISLIPFSCDPHFESPFLFLLSSFRTLSSRPSAASLSQSHWPGWWVVLRPEFHPNLLLGRKVPAQRRMKHPICPPFSEGSQTAPFPAVSVSYILQGCVVLPCAAGQSFK